MALNLVQAHGMMMILAWMTFGSTGVLIARYGRSFRFSGQRQFLGKALWFQIHRFLLSVTPILTLLGFFFILAHADGKWVPLQYSLILFIHSIFGSIVICCAIIQIWLVLYRCHPHSRFRFIFDCCHHLTGKISFILSIVTIFLIIGIMSKFRIAPIILMSLWTTLTIIVIIIFEKLQYQQRIAIPSAVSDIPVNNGRRQDTNNSNRAPDIEAGTNLQIDHQRHNQLKLFLFLIYAIFSSILSILLIIFITL